MFEKAILLISILMISATGFAQSSSEPASPDSPKTSLEENIGSAVDVADVKKHFFGIFGAAGLPATTSFGAAYYYGEARNFGFIYQTGSGKLDGTIYFDNKYNELLFVYGETAYGEWNKVGGFGFGQQELKVGVDYKDKDGVLFAESDTIKNTYFKMSLGMNKFYRSGFNWGFDFGFTFSLNKSADTYANPNATNASSDHPTYGTTKEEYNLIHKLLAEGISLQFNLIKVGWYF